MTVSAVLVLCRTAPLPGFHPDRIPERRPSALLIHLRPSEFGLTRDPPPTLDITPRPYLPVALVAGRPGQ